MVRLESCTQPECYLREDGVDCDDLAEIFVRVLSAYILMDWPSSEKMKNLLETAFLGSPQRPHRRQRRN